MTGASRRLVVVSGGLSQPSSTRLLADRLASAVQRRLAEGDVRVETTVVELREHAHDITSHLLRGFGTVSLDDAITALADADGAIMVTPIFTTSYSGLFKSFLDILDPKALTGLPVLLAATGGTERHSLALDYAIRPLFTYLHAMPVPTSVYAATSDWGTATDGAAEQLLRRVTRAAEDLAREMTRPDRTAVDRAPDPMAIPAGFDPSGATALRAGGRS